MSNDLDLDLGMDQLVSKQQSKLRRKMRVLDSLLSDALENQHVMSNLEITGCPWSQRKRRDMCPSTVFCSSWTTRDYAAGADTAI